MTRDTSTTREDAMDLIFGYLIVAAGRKALARAKAAIGRIRSVIVDAHRNRAARLIEPSGYGLAGSHDSDRLTGR
jgi:hypothetical protein